MGNEAIKATPEHTPKEELSETAFQTNYQFLTTKVLLRPDELKTIREKMIWDTTEDHLEASFKILAERNPKEPRPKRPNRPWHAFGGTTNDLS